MVDLSLAHQGLTSLMATIPTAARVHLLAPDPALALTWRSAFEDARLSVVMEGTLCPDPGYGVSPDPRCFVLHLSGSGHETLEWMERLQDEGQPLSAIVLMDSPQAATAVRAMKAGACDLLPVEIEPTILVGAVRRCLETDASRREEIRSRAEASRRLDTLSRRESEVLGHVLNGLSNRDMAEAMGVSVKTIEAHRANLMRKSGCRAVATLVKLAVQAGVA